MKTTIRLFLLLAVLFTLPLLRHQTYLPLDLLSLNLPWKAEIKTNDFQNHFYADAVGEYLPWKMLIGQQLRAGELPLWNPYNYLGTPLLATAAPQVLDPFNLLMFTLEPHTSFDLGLVLKILLAGLFMGLLLRQYGVRGAANAIGSLAYALNGAFIANLHFGWMIGTFMWIPLTLLFLERTIKTLRWQDGALSSFFLSLAIISGNLQTFLHTLFLLILWAGSSLYLESNGRKKPAIFILFALIFGLLLSSIVVLPTLELLSFGISRQEAINFSPWFADLGGHFLRIPFLLSFAFPHFFGHHSIFSPVLVTGTKWSDFIQGHIGLVPLFLAVTALIAVRKPLVKKWGFVGIASLLLLLATPLERWLYQRGLILWCLSGSILAGLGAKHLFEGKQPLPVPWRKIRYSLAVGTVALGGIVWFIAVSVRLFEKALIRFGEGFIQTFTANLTTYASLKPFYLEKVAATLHYYTFSNPNILFTLVLVFALFLLIKFFSTQKISPLGACRILLFLTVFETVYFAAQYVPRVSLKDFPLYPETPAIRFLKGDTQPFRAMSVVDRGRGDPIFYEESNIPAGIQTVHNTGSLVFLPSLTFSEILTPPPFGNRFHPELTNLANVKYILTDSIELDPRRYPLVYEGEIRIYENPHVLPRLFVPKKIAPATSDEAVYASFAKPDYRAQDVAWLDPLPDRLPKRQGEGKTSVHFRKYYSNHVEAVVETEHDQVFVLSDTYYPGWKAMLDGVETPIYKANTLFRAVYVPAGNHRLEFVFRPASVVWGATITFMGFLIVGISLAFQFLRRPKEVPSLVDLELEA